MTDLVKLAQAREALAAEWLQWNPQTPNDVERFYKHSRGLKADLDAWHDLPGRQYWTKCLIDVVAQSKARMVIDIGCGVGHDLRALRDAYLEIILVGVEPNDELRLSLNADGFTVVDDVRVAPIERADVLQCIDVLEHLPDPESWLVAVIDRAPSGCVLIETCATDDEGTPLHLASNRGWFPNACLEFNGWKKAGGDGTRLEVWQKE